MDDVEKTYEQSLSGASYVIAIITKQLELDI
jgi:hypothetical protein